MLLVFMVVLSIVVVICIHNNTLRRRAMTETERQNEDAEVEALHLKGEWW